MQSNATGLRMAEFREIDSDRSFLSTIAHSIEIMAKLKLVVPCKGIEDDKSTTRYQWIRVGWNGS